MTARREVFHGDRERSVDSRRIEVWFTQAPRKSLKRLIVAAQLLHSPQMDQLRQGGARFDLGNPHIARAASGRPHAEVAAGIDAQTAARRGCGRAFCVAGIHSNGKHGATLHPAQSRPEQFISALCLDETAVLWPGGEGKSDPTAREIVASSRLARTAR